MKLISTLALSAIAVAIAGCSGAQQSLPAVPYMNGGAAMQALNATGAGKIKHVVFIIQENRSFDNLFQGYPGADTVSKGYDSKGKAIKLRPEGLGKQYVLDHSLQAFFEDCNGTGSEPGTDCRMNGFNNEESFGGPKNPAYVYVPHADSKPYFDMAHEGVLADRMFQSQLDESFVAHQYAVAAQAHDAVNAPNSSLPPCSDPKKILIQTLRGRGLGGYESACFNYTTLGDELDKTKLTWRYYASEYGSGGSGEGSIWSAYTAVKHIYDGPDWKKDVISPNWKFITDVRHGELANFTWVTPVCDDSDHVNCGGGYGPSWVAALVNTVGKSKFWDSTAIFVMWDDWGGLYDHVAPAYLSDDSLGLRVPLIIMSPYAKAGHVSHVGYETTSVLRFAEDVFGLPQMTRADTRAASPAADCFDFNQSPRKFVPIKAPLPPKFFMHQNDENNYFAPDYD